MIIRFLPLRYGLIFLTVISSCQKPQSTCFVQYHEIRQLLGGPIEEIDLLDNCLSTKFNDQFDELAGVSWKEKKYMKDGNIIFRTESNWVNDSIVSRIIILHPSIKIYNDLFVGQCFGAIKRLLSEDIPSVQDGYLLLKDKNDSSLSVELDIEHLQGNEKLYFGVSDLDEIPDSLKVKSLILLKQ